MNGDHIQSAGRSFLFVCSLSLYLQPQKEDGLKLKKYISGELFVKLGFFIVLVCAAVVFDHFHQGKDQPDLNAAGQEQNATEDTMTCYCAPVFSISLKAPVQKISFGKNMQEKFHRIIREQRYAMAFYISKAEVFSHPDLVFSLRVLISLRCRIVTDPGNHPPLI
jgi:hypothetical protein